MIRRATVEDAPRIAELGALFHAASPWRDVPYDLEAAEAFAAGVVSVGAVFLSEGGMIGAVPSPLFFNPAVKVVAEMFWWAPDGEGQALREALETWADDQGAAFTQFSALHDERAPRMEKMFRRLGYEPVEIGYRKALS